MRRASSSPYLGLQRGWCSRSPGGFVNAMWKGIDQAHRCPGLSDAQSVRGCRMARLGLGFAAAVSAEPETASVLAAVARQNGLEQGSAKVDGDERAKESAEAFVVVVVAGKRVNPAMTWREFVEGP